LTPTRIIAALALLLLAVIVGAFIYARAFSTYSLAVLPIVNETGPANDFLSHGLTVAITEKLTGLSHLRVRRLRAFADYKGNEVHLQRLGGNLGLDALLVGRIVDEQGTLVLEMALVDSTTGKRREIGKDNLTLSSAFAIPEEVSRQVTTNLEMWLRK